MNAIADLPPEAATALARAVDVAASSLPLLDVGGIALFALSGALAAARAKQTLVTFAFFALVTGVGGGTIRDLLIGAPVFWLHADWVPLTCLAMAGVVWLTWEMVKWCRCSENARMTCSPRSSEVMKFGSPVWGSVMGMLCSLIAQLCDYRP